jgi:hypothetical protein
MKRIDCDCKSLSLREAIKLSTPVENLFKTQRWQAGCANFLIAGNLVQTLGLRMSGSVSVVRDIVDSFYTDR